MRQHSTHHIVPGKVKNTIYCVFAENFEMFTVLSQVLSND